ncbi:MAG: hypothetical protein EXR77_06840 [Myxococcales bacterium]|nr:hypothetical protein [Myxococcales bacterium]
MQARDNGDVDRVRHRRTATDWKQEANAVRLSVYAELLKLDSVNGYGKAFAEAFFASNGEPSAAVAPVEVAPATDVPVG